MPEPQPTRMKLNSGMLSGPPEEARRKNTAGGSVSTLVSMPMRVSICATTSTILASLT